MIAKTTPALAAVLLMLAAGAAAREHRVTVRIGQCSCGNTPLAVAVYSDSSADVVDADRVQMVHIPEEQLEAISKKAASPAELGLHGWLSYVPPELCELTVVFPGETSPAEYAAYVRRPDVPATVWTSEDGQVTDAGEFYRSHKVEELVNSILDAIERPRLFASCRDDAPSH